MYVYIYFEDSMEIVEVCDLYKDFKNPSCDDLG